MQGINDLVTPFLAVFLSPHFSGAVEEWGEIDLPEEVWDLSTSIAHADKYSIGHNRAYLLFN